MAWNHKTLLVLVVIALLAGTAAAVIESSEGEPVRPASYVSKTSEEAGVTVSVTPDISGSTWRFGVSLDTHSGSLDQNPGGGAELRDENGNVSPLIRWNGDPPGGHHRSGILEFEPIVPAPRTITLVIRNIGPERIFTWNLR